MAYLNNSVFWVGADGNAYVKSGNSVQNYGKVSAANNNGAEAALGSIEATRINDPNPRPTNTGNYSLGNPGGNTGGTTPGVNDPATIAYYDQLIGEAQNSLGRLNSQEHVGYSNIDNSYTDSLNQLKTSKAIADRDWETGHNASIQDNIAARGKITRNVSNSILGAQNMLGMQGAGRSSAATELLPFLIAQQGTEGQRDIQTKFNQNMAAFDTKKKDQEDQFNQNKTSLDLDHTNKRNTFAAGIQNSAASINQQMRGYQLQKASAQGKSYDQAKAEATPYTNAINAALDAAVSLGQNAKVNPVGEIKYSTPDLQKYDPTGITVGTSGQTGVQQQTAPYYSLISGNQDKKDKDLVTA